MKRIIAALALALSVLPAFATNYFHGQCPVAGHISGTTPGSTAGPGNCSFGSNPVNASTFRDTVTFYLGNWNEFYGIWTYTSTSQVVASGGTGITPCSGRGCHGQPYQIVIDSATIDGVPMRPPASGYTWTLPVDLAPGSHVMAVTGHASGATWYAHWSGAAQGVMYTLEALPPPPPCTSNCEDN